MHTASTRRYAHRLCPDNKIQLVEAYPEWNDNSTALNIGGQCKIDSGGKIAGDDWVNLGGIDIDGVRGDDRPKKRKNRTL